MVDIYDYKWMKERTLESDRLKYRKKVVKQCPQNIHDFPNP